MEVHLYKSATLPQLIRITKVDFSKNKLKC